MAWHIGKSDYDQQAVVWGTEDKGKYALVKLGTSRKDKKSGEYVNSNWSFVRFVGKAFDGIMDVPERTRIIIKSGLIEHAPYMENGEKKWAKNPSIVVFAWEFPEDDGEKKTPRRSSEPVEPTDEELSDELGF